MKLLVKKGTTSKTALVFIQDSSSTTGAGLTSLAFGSSGLTWYYYREGAGTGATQVTLATQTIGTWATGGFIELDATDMPGWYEIGIPNAVLASGADFVGMVLKGATNMAQLNIEIQLTDVDLSDGVRAGLTALPNAAADAAGGLAISDAGGLDLDQIGTDTAAILVDTAVIGPLGAGLTDLGGMSTAMKAEVNAECDTALTDYDAATGTEMATAQADLDTITGTDGVTLATDAISAAAVSAAGGAKIADITLRRTQANVEASSDGDTISGRSLYGATAKLVNKTSISGSTLTVTKSDDSTSVFTQSLTTSASADPVTASDTV
jgi:hypothetical protein